MMTKRTAWLSSLTITLLLGFVLTASASADDDSGFLSDTARIASSDGSPVGPPKRIIICHKGHTITVSERSVPAHLAHGDTLGPCPDDVVICHRGRTITVNEDSLPAHLAHGDTLGPCANDVFMCNKLGHTIVVQADRVAIHLARGQTLGLCPGKTLICHKGKTIKVNDSTVPDHLAHGDYLGYCLGGPGPLVPGNSAPTSVSVPR